MLTSLSLYYHDIYFCQARFLFFENFFYLEDSNIPNHVGIYRMPVRAALLLLPYQNLMIRLPNNHVSELPLKIRNEKQFFLNYGSDNSLEQLHTNIVKCSM